MRNPTYNSEYPARYIRPALCAVLLHHHTFSRIKRSNQATIPCGTCRYYIYPKKSSNHHGKSEIPYCPAELANWARLQYKTCLLIATDTRNYSLFNTKEEVTVNIMYIHLSSLRQTRFGYADSAFLSFIFFADFFVHI